MRRLLAVAQLGFNFLKEVVISGWVTTRIILAGTRGLQPGFVRFDYGELPDGAASLLAALVTLTPGTTTVDIDLERREFHMHLLDLERAEATLAGIRRDFLGPIRTLFGVEP